MLNFFITDVKKNSLLGLKCVKSLTVKVVSDEELGKSRWVKDASPFPIPLLNMKEGKNG